jgi:aminopeptidase N
MNPIHRVIQGTARVFVTAGIFLGGVVGAQTPGAPGLNDPIFPWMGNGGYDAQDYNINLRFSDDKRSETGTTTMEALATQDLSQFDLDFGSMTVSGVTVNGAAARFQQSDPELVIVPAQALKNGEKFRVTVSYSGVPGSKANPNEFDDAFWLVNNNTLTVLSQPSGMFMWSPVNEHPSDKATYTIALTAPKADTAVVSGQLVGSTDNSDGTKTTTFRIATPTTTYVVMMSVGDYTLEEQGKVGNVRVRHYLSPATTPVMRQAVLETPKIISFFNERLTPYPFPEVGVITTDNDLGFALETQTLVTLPASFGGGESLGLNAMVVAHELAHLWFSSLVTYKTNKDIWVHEGFAEYLGDLYVSENLKGSYPSLEETITGNYPSVANGLYVRTLEKSELVGALKTQFKNAALKPEDVARALDLIFSGTLPAAYRDSIVARKPASFNALADAIAALPFERVVLPVRAQSGLSELAGRKPQARRPGWDVLTPPGGLKAGDDLFNAGVYDRGEMALYALRAKLGDTAFWALLRAYLEKYKFGSASNEDFINLTGELNGAAAKALVNAWVNDPQTPDLPELGLKAADYKLGATFK